MRLKHEETGEATHPVDVCQTFHSSCQARLRNPSWRVARYARSPD